MTDPEPVTVATFSSATDAELARARLEAEGILALVGDAEMTTLLPNVVGGAKLQVAQTDAPRATMLLGEWRHTGQAANKRLGADDPGAGAIVCLACGASMSLGESHCPACGWTYLEDRGARVEG